MTNWHIEFTVTGKYLSDAQASVHRLRGVTGIGVRPIAEKDLSSNGARGPYKPRGTFNLTGSAAITTILDKARGPMTSAMLGEAFEKQGRSAISVSSVLHKMRTDGLIISTAEGYVLSKKMKDRLRHRKGAK